MRSTDVRILDYVRCSNEPDRADIARDLELPTPTVVSAVRRLVASGALIEAKEAGQPKRAGRPSRGLRVAGPTTVIGLIGWHGDSLRALCLGLDGTVLHQTELPRPDPGRGVSGLFDAVDAVVAQTDRLPDHRLGVIVVSIPAPFLSGRGVPAEAPSGETGATQFPLIAAGDVEGALTERHDVPVLMENDANLAAIGELYRGAGRDIAHSIYLKLTPYGVGSALIVNGRLVRGAQGFAGELSHLQVDRDGVLCACGGRGCLLYRVREQILAAAQPAYDEPISYGDLPRLAQAGDLGAVRMLHDIGRTLGEPLARLSTFLDPERIIVGGSFGASTEDVIVGIREALAVQAPPAIATNVQLVTGELADQGEEQGALELARLAARHG